MHARHSRPHEARLRRWQGSAQRLDSHVSRRRPRTDRRGRRAAQRAVPVDRRRLDAPRGPAQRSRPEPPEPRLAAARDRRRGARLPRESGRRRPRARQLVAIVLVAFCLLGPYSLLAGAMALDLGGRRGSATAVGLIDSAGYLGAVLSGYALGAIVDALGWPAAFLALAAVCLASTLTVLVYVREHATGPVPREATT